MRTQVGIVQLCATEDVAANLDNAMNGVADAAAGGAEVVMLPEAFAYVGRTRGRLAMAESIDAPGPILSRCSEIARLHGVELLLGGFPEARDEESTWNTSILLDAQGCVRARYRKIHRFDVELADGTVLHESRSTGAGEEAVLAQTRCGPTGLTICYDVRFPALFEALAQRGARVMTVPSAFTATTGAAHWHALLRARAIETQCWVIAPAQWGAHGGGRTSYGHSLVVDPWGVVQLDMKDRLGTEIVRIEDERVDEVRSQLPSLKHRRDFR